MADWGRPVGACFFWWLGAGGTELPRQGHDPGSLRTVFLCWFGFSKASKWNSRSLRAEVRAGREDIKQAIASAFRAFRAFRARSKQEADV
jgi:hypothetical protein